MAYTLRIDEREIQDQIDKAWEAGQHWSQWPGMTYEDGVRNALGWVLGNSETGPMDEE